MRLLWRSHLSDRAQSADVPIDVPANGWHARLAKFTKRESSGEAILAQSAAGEANLASNLARSDVSDAAGTRLDAAQADEYELVEGNAKEEESWPKDALVLMSGGVEGECSWCLRAGLHELKGKGQEAYGATTRLSAWTELPVRSFITSGSCQADMEDTQLAKRGFKHFKINNILIIHCFT